MFDFIIDFFKALFDMIPKLMYLLYSSLACLIDVLQLFFRKLAGLDVVYITDPVTGVAHRTTGDIVTNFITGILGWNRYGLQYSILSTVFLSFIIFGVIILFAATLVAIIKGHYNYDEKAAKGPLQYVYTAGRSLLSMAIIPIVIVLGLYVSQALLTALDQFTSTSDTAIISLYGTDAVHENLLPSQTARSYDENQDSVYSGEVSYVYYDIFGANSGIWYGDVLDWAVDKFFESEVPALSNIASTNATFSGSLFKAAAYNGNRARINNWYSNESMNRTYTGGANSEYQFKLFENASGDEELAEMIDTAFACNLHVLDSSHAIHLHYGDGEGWAWVSPTFFTQFFTSTSIAFSKFNIGLVWYYYDLWNFNFIIGFGSVVVCVTIFLNIIMGLMSRLLMCLVLFFIAPPLYGLAPLDGGQAAKNWRENFMKQVLMTYGAVVGMNLVLLLLPYINQIKFFNIGIADALATTLFIIVGLVTIKAVIATVSAIIGAADANKTGDDMKADVAGGIAGGLKMTAGAAKFSAKVARLNPFERGVESAFRLGGKLGNTVTSKIGAAADAGNVHAQRARALGHFFTGKTAWQQAAWNGWKDASGKEHMGMKKFFGKAGNALYGAGIREKQELKETQDFKNTEALMKEFDNTNVADFDKAYVEQRARESGMSASRARAFAQSMERIKNSGTATKFTMADMQAQFDSNDARYHRQQLDYGMMTDNEFNRFVKTRQRAVDRRKNSAFNKATGSWKDANPLHWINDAVLSSDKGLSAVRDAVKKPIDQSRRAADAAEANLRQQKEVADLLNDIKNKLP